MLSFFGKWLSLDQDELADDDFDISFTVNRLMHDDDEDDDDDYEYDDEEEDDNPDFSKLWDKNDQYPVFVIILGG